MEKKGDCKEKSKIDTIGWETMETEMKFEEDKSIEERILEAIRLPKRSTDEHLAHYPSELMMCMRARYYAWMSREDLEEEFDEILLRERPVDEAWLKKMSIYKMGNAVEDELGGWLMMAGLLPSPNRMQYRVRSRKHLISGNIDFVILLDGKDIPIECKSAKSSAFKSWSGYFCTNCNGKNKRNALKCKDCAVPRPELEFRWTYEGFDRKPSLSHYAQLQSYLNIGNFEYGYLYYYNKDTSERKWYRIERDEEFWTEVQQQNLRLMDCVEKRDIPDRQHNADFDLNGDICDSSDWQCQFCDWHRICWADKITENLSEREKEIARLFERVK